MEEEGCNKRLGERLLQMRVATSEDLRNIEREAERSIEEAVKFAEESALPDPEETLEDVYANPS